MLLSISTKKDYWIDKIVDTNENLLEFYVNIIEEYIILDNKTNHNLNTLEDQIFNKGSESLNYNDTDNNNNNNNNFE